VCPSGAISILGKKPAESRPMADIRIPSLKQMDDLVRDRRSIRHYRDENVDPALLSGLLETLAYAPTGVNRQELTFNVIDDKTVMSRFRDRLLTALTEAAAKRGCPSRLKLMASQPREVAERRIFRSAPHVLIVSAPVEAPCAAQDVIVALSYFELLAQSAGLGTVWWGLLKFIVAGVPEVKSFLGIPDNHEYYAVLFGMPAIKFARIPQREGAAKVRRIAM
jgi:nitroreductase